MAENRRDVVVRFLANTGQLEKGSDVVRGRLQGVASGLQGIAALGAVVAGVNFFKSAIDEAREAERVTRKTEAVLKSTGGVAKVTAGDVGELSESMSNLAGVDDEVIQQGANVLLTFKGVRNEVGQGNDIFNQAAKTSLDMAAALDKTGDSGASMQENVIRIGKALNDPIKGMTALTKVGVTFTEQQKSQITALVESGDIMGAQKIILGELQSEFGGMAAASADATDKAIVGWGNFAESVGKKVMPAVNAVSNWALHTGLPVLGDVAETVGNVVEPAFNGLVTAGQGVVSMWRDMPAPIQTGIIALGAWQLVGDRVTGTFGRMSGSANSLGSDVKTAMGAFDVGAVRGTMMALEERIPVVGRMGQSFRDAAGTTMALGTAMGGVQGHATAFAGALKGTASAAMTGLKAAAGGVVGLLGGPWGVALAGGAAAIAWFSSRSAEAEQKQRDLAEAGRSVARAIAEQQGILNSATRQTAAKVAEDKGLLKLADELGISLPRVTDAVEGQKGAYHGLKGELDSVIAARQEELKDAQAVRGNDEKIAGLEAEIGKYTELRDGLGSTVTGRNSETEAIKRKTEAEAASVAATAGAAGAADVAKTSTELFAGVMDQAGIELEEGADGANHMREAIEALTRAETMQMDTLEGYEASLDNLSASVVEHGNTLDIHTEAGRANRDALQAAASASRDLMMADIEAGVPMGEALKRHQDRINTLHTEAGKTFTAKEEARGLIDMYGKVPGNVVTAIETQGAEKVQAELAKMSAGQYLLAQGKELTEHNVRATVQDRKYAYASGGFVSGPGGPRDDKVRAWLSNGEFVEQADAVQYYGPGFMHALNDKRIPRESLPQFAGGGMVWPYKVDVSQTKIPKPDVARGPGGAGMGWQNMWAVVKGQFGNATLNSSFRPGDPGYHGRGRAIDIGGPMPAINRWLAGAYPNSTELIYTPGINLWHGRPHTYKAATRADHFDHVHWAMARGGLVGPEPSTFDTGGWLNPGETGVNKGKAREAVLTPEESVAHKALAKAAASGNAVGTTVEKHFHLTTITQAHQIDVPTQFAKMEWAHG